MKRKNEFSAYIDSKGEKAEPEEWCEILDKRVKDLIGHGIFSATIMRNSKVITPVRQERATIISNTFIINMIPVKKVI